MVTEGFRKLFLTGTKRPRAEPIKQSSQSPGSFETEFQQMLVNTSDWYDEYGSLDQLKMLCKDLIRPFNDLQKAKCTMEVFKLMQSAGYLTATNFEVLIDVINVTGKQGVLEENKLLKDTYEKADDQVKSFTSYRQKLIKFGNKLSEGNVTTLVNLEKISKKYSGNQWTVILDLEQRGILNIHKLEPFIEMLKEKELTLAAEELEDSDECCGNTTWFTGT
ncbi:uncharacterized protein [Antedon mediterranea]|uniref:uncharacterized protein n=1 Tax=Antedon mediterranea TaxID=105859 RepID=UPI003AF693CB